jgi:hypothetical protein
MGCRLAAVVTIPLLPNEGAVRGSLSLALRDASFRYIGSYISGAPTSAICNCLLRPDAWTYDGVVHEPVSSKGGADASAVIGNERMRQIAVDDVYDRAVESMAQAHCYRSRHGRVRWRLACCGVPAGRAWRLRRRRIAVCRSLGWWNK